MSNRGREGERESLCDHGSRCDSWNGGVSVKHGPWTPMER